MWAGWRSAYLESGATGGLPVDPHEPGRSIFERILASGEPDERTRILWRGERCFAILNAFPYGSGHLMVMPQRAAADLADLDSAESAELWAGVQAAVRAVRLAYSPDGVNVGINLGEAAGAGVPEHLHVHVLPRWSGDTNFTTTVAETRVLPEPLDLTWQKLTRVWGA